MNDIPSTILTSQVEKIVHTFRTKYVNIGSVAKSNNPPTGMYHFVIILCLCNVVPRILCLNLFGSSSLESCAFASGYWCHAVGKKFGSFDPENNPPRPALLRANWGGSRLSSCRILAYLILAAFSSAVTAAIASNNRVSSPAR